MTNKEIVEKLEEALRNEGHPYGLELNLDGVTLKKVEMVGGEGQGDHHYVVYKITTPNGSFFVKADGGYSSYDGTDYSYCDVYEVEPYEKTVRDWREVNNN